MTNGINRDAPSRSLQARIREQIAFRLRHDRDPDDEIGVLLDDEGSIPAEAQGKHCKWCGEEIMVALGHGGPAQAGSVQEYVHSATRLAHCVLAWHKGVNVALAEETAAPCWKPGCKSNAGYMAQEEADDRPQEP